MIGIEFNWRRRRKKGEKKEEKKKKKKEKKKEEKKKKEKKRRRRRRRRRKKKKRRRREEEKKKKEKKKEEKGEKGEEEEEEEEEKKKKRRRRIPYPTLLLSHFSTSVILFAFGRSSLIFRSSSCWRISVSSLKSLLKGWLSASQQILKVLPFIGSTRPLLNLVLRSPLDFFLNTISLCYYEQTIAL